MDDILILKWKHFDFFYVCIFKVRVSICSLAPEFFCSIGSFFLNMHAFKTTKVKCNKKYNFKKFDSDFDEIAWEKNL